MMAVLSRRRVGKQSNQSMSFGLVESRVFGPATFAKVPPQTEPRAMRQHCIMSLICRGDVAFREQSHIRRFKHFLYLLHFVNNAFDVRFSNSIANEKSASGGLKAVCSDGCAGKFDSTSRRTRDPLRISVTRCPMARGKHRFISVSAFAN